MLIPGIEFLYAGIVTKLLIDKLTISQSIKTLIITGKYYQEYGNHLQVEVNLTEITP